ncbi:CDGP domain-containing protein [Mycolicibacter icosiumassiliensis]|uniref:CDGP domain-containing protein n=1 Tax=Mycolicibacter icosiumassiliensis TaxID=1792835 RepID=UPI000ADB1B1A|nr:hypothetical protein [Mycolicibacter icosiumassiliensis]
MGCIRRLSFVVAILVAAAASTPVAAQAVPGDPQPGCESNFWGSMYCDGPIREDGTWKRCATWQPSYVPGGSYIPGGNKCDIIDQGSIPFGTPDHHIEE